MITTLHNYSYRQFHRTSSGIYPSHCFRDMGSAKSSLLWPVFGPWASPYGQITMTLHNYRCTQAHETLNGINPSSSFRDMCSKSGANLWQKFFTHGQAHMAQVGKWLWQCTTTGLDNYTELGTEKICKAVSEIWVLQVWHPHARHLPRWQYPYSPEDWGVKIHKKETQKSEGMQSRGLRNKN